MGPDGVKPRAVKARGRGRPPLTAAGRAGPGQRRTGRPPLPGGARLPGCHQRGILLRCGGSRGREFQLEGRHSMTPGCTILIADDEPAIRQLIRVTLSRTPYRVLEAADGDAAWDLLQAQRPAVAILDIRMPGRDGLALTRAIRADP